MAYPYFALRRHEISKPSSKWEYDAQLSAHDHICDHEHKPVPAQRQEDSCLIVHLQGSGSDRFAHV